jgi:hypothetical protein
VGWANEQSLYSLMTMPYPNNACKKFVSTFVNTLPGILVGVNGVYGPAYFNVVMASVVVLCLSTLTGKSVPPADPDNGHPWRRIIRLRGSRINVIKLFSLRLNQLERFSNINF